MTALGKCLVFHLKYQPEMKRLYWEEGKLEPDGLPDPERVLAIVRDVGDQACEDAADFLEACAERVQGHFSGFCDFRRNTRRSKVLVSWGIAASVRLADRPDRVFQVGVMLNDDIGAVVPWLWCKGGKRAEGLVAQILASACVSRSGEGLVQASGTLALSRIPILPEGHQGFDLDRDPLVQQVESVFRMLSRSKVDAILALE
jgi:hypothetical protein